MSMQTKALAGFACMVNTDLCILGQAQSVAFIADIMQHSVSHWEDLLEPMGGALVPEKCFWYLLEFKRFNGTWQYGVCSCTKASLQVKNSHGHCCIIEHQEPHKAQWTLGVRLAPDGNCMAELQYLQSIATE